MEKVSDFESRQMVLQEYYDPLTGGYNRKGFIREAEKILANSSAEKNFVIIAVDIQKFKSINDIFGLGGGDKLLTYMYQCIQKDSDRIELIGRLEADCFICLMEREKLELNKFGKMLKFWWSYEERTIQINLHSGIYFIEDRTIPINSMIEWAVMANQFTEKESIQQYAIFDQRMRQDYISKAEILSSFRRGIKEEEFLVYYQPIVQLSTSHVVAAEALARWKHGHLGFISPTQFIPVLESSGMITELDRYMLQKVNAYMERIAESSLPIFSLAINLSWQDFYDQKMVDDIIQSIGVHREKDRKLNFEVTETSLAALEQNSGYIMKQFQEGGAKILLDDFGSGVSSLGMIGNYSFDIIKIDRSFICRIGDNATIRSIIQSIIQMCHNIGLKVLGEGVETETELKFLREAKCDYVQGYYYAKPMPEEEFNQYVLTHGSIDYNDKAVQLAITRVKQPVLNEEFYKKLLDQIDKFISVINPEDYSLIYLNKTAREIKMNTNDYQGEKCYYYMERLEKPCGHCVMKNLQYDAARKLTVGSGDFLLEVTASMWEINGKKIFVEIGEKQDSRSGANEYIRQVKGIIEMLPSLQSVFHFDVTEDRMLSFSGKFAKVSDTQLGSRIDWLIHRIAARIVDCKMQKDFFAAFGRDAMLKAYDAGNYQYSRDIVLYFGEDEVYQTRATVDLIYNQDTGNIECILYGIDISDEEEPKEGKAEKENFFNMYQQADHDRRIDYLTGLRNRLDLNEQFMVFEKEESASVQAVYMLDIDDFKKINDRYGHIIGDECLRRFGEVLRNYEIEHGITFFRYGGEEILGIDTENRTDVQKVAGEILDQIREIEVKTDSSERITFTVSIGYTKQKDALKKMIEYADKAMYLAKKRGKNCFFAYDIPEE